ncbi:SdpI family protein [Bizionia arctica]|uniref:DUF1648 domain-containing protein n=1 Tax=Bizionia arctica TaxID=1495645 RepID=A0A917LRR9_9FLAO|nr:SdpI family protein [Bizionia arctica]GGG53789.1 hypothetical protein GCM10010976_25950 [Bizionia arctica]
MKPTLKKDLPLIPIILLPFIYLAYIWNSLPQEVPLQWNINGDINTYGDKGMLIFIPILLPLLMYLIFLIVPKIDPKNKLNAMGNKLQNMKILLTLFMSLLALFILYSAKNESLENPNYLILGIGVLFLILGNYFKTIQPNYFIGIKTPWTLESESVWKKTHKMAGKMWFVGGFVIILGSLVLSQQINRTVFLIITGIITIIPILFSYFEYKKEKQTA